ncbi:hypothetical protein GOV12_05230 [Candidatus Pacearchaeota archaeon]|nr:hypothetical protein [Candidatus Pacearchaeota archaeon]
MKKNLYILIPLIYILIFLLLLFERVINNYPLSFEMLDLFIMSILYSIPLISTIFIVKIFINRGLNKFLTLIFSTLITLAIAIIPIIGWSLFHIGKECVKLFLCYIECSGCLDFFTLISYLIPFYIIIGIIISVSVIWKKELYLSILIIILSLILLTFIIVPTINNCGFNGCYLKALEESNPDYCKEFRFIKSPILVLSSLGEVQGVITESEDCYNDLALQNKDVSICYNLEDYSPHGEHDKFCIRTFFDKYNIECNQLNDQRYSDFCYYLKGILCRKPNDKECLYLNNPSITKKNKIVFSKYKHISEDDLKTCLELRKKHCALTTDEVCNNIIDKEMKDKCIFNKENPWN